MGQLCFSKDKDIKNGEYKKGSVKSTRRISISDWNLNFQIIGKFLNAV
jgi:hypothetical protein